MFQAHSEVGQAASEVQFVGVALGRAKPLEHHLIFDFKTLFTNRGEQFVLVGEVPIGGGRTYSGLASEFPQRQIRRADPLEHHDGRINKCRSKIAMVIGLNFRLAFF